MEFPGKDVPDGSKTIYIALQALLLGPELVGQVSFGWGPLVNRRLADLAVEFFELHLAAELLQAPAG